METDQQPSTTTELSPLALAQLRQALEIQYPASKAVLGCQLGAFIHQHLPNADLKVRFGGLKNFVAHYFPVEITWRGRKGLDDLYDIAFATDLSGEGRPAWTHVEAKPSSGLWSAVTNPAMRLQFAWSAKDAALVQASPGVPISEELTLVEKLTKADYQLIATAFVHSIPSIDASRYLQVIERSGSSVEFTNLIRDDGLLSKWEEFRVDHALRLFTDRLQAAGAEAEEATRWADLLRASQQDARVQRVQKSSASPVIRKSWPLTHGRLSRQNLPDVRVVAMKSLEFVSDAELNELRLPLGSVMQALRALF